jgi:transposase
MVRRYEISDTDWQRIAPLLKGKPGDVGRSGADNRLFINAVIWLARSGAAWRDLPERYGPWNTVCRRFRRWARSGHWQAIFQALQDPDLDWAMLDSTTVRAHQHAAGPKKVRLPTRPSDAAGVG